MSRTFSLSVIFAAALCCGCVATQNVPVSTDPSGAAVYLDGKTVCAATPCSVEIEKNQDHLLTIIKPGYRQRDVPVRRVYDTVGVLRDSAVKAVKGGGLAGTVDALDKREQDGSAYVLEPRLVTLRLKPEGEPDDEPAVAGEPSADGAVQPGLKRRADGSVDPVEMGLELFKMMGKGAGRNAAPER
jgi:hypothetical protein